jgi:hypothetical protein
LKGRDGSLPAPDEVLDQSPPSTVAAIQSQSRRIAPRILTLTSLAPPNAAKTNDESLKHALVKSAAVNSVSSQVISAAWMPRKVDLTKLAWQANAFSKQARVKSASAKLADVARQFLEISLFFYRFLLQKIRFFQ